MMQIQQFSRSSQIKQQLDQAYNQRSEILNIIRQNLSTVEQNYFRCLRQPQQFQKNELLINKIYRIIPFMNGYFKNAKSRTSDYQIKMSSSSDIWIYTKNQQIYLSRDAYAKALSLQLTGTDFQAASMAVVQTIQQFGIKYYMQFITSTGSMQMLLPPTGYLSLMLYHFIFNKQSFNKKKLTITSKNPLYFTQQKDKISDYLSLSIYIPCNQTKRGITSTQIENYINTGTESQLEQFQKFQNLILQAQVKVQDIQGKITAIEQNIPRSVQQVIDQSIGSGEDMIKDQQVQNLNPQAVRTFQKNDKQLNLVIKDQKQLVQALQTVNFDQITRNAQRQILYQQMNTGVLYFIQQIRKLIATNTDFQLKNLNGYPQQISTGILLITNRRKLMKTKLHHRLIRNIVHIKKLKKSGGMTLSSFQNFFSQLQQKYMQQLEQYIKIPGQQIKLLQLKGKRLIQQNISADQLRQKADQIYSTTSKTNKIIEIAHAQTIRSMTDIYNAVKSNEASLLFFSSTIQNNISAKYNNLAETFRRYSKEIANQFKNQLHRVQNAVNNSFSDIISYVDTLSQSLIQVLDKLKNISQQLKKIGQTTNYLKIKFDENFQKTNKIFNSLDRLREALQKNELQNRIKSNEQYKESLRSRLQTQQDISKQRQRISSFIIQNDKKMSLQIQEIKKTLSQQTVKVKQAIKLLKSGVSAAVTTKGVQNQTELKTAIGKLVKNIENTFMQQLQKNSKISQETRNKLKNNENQQIQKLILKNNQNLQLLKQEYLKNIAKITTTIKNADKVDTSNLWAKIRELADTSKMGTIFAEYNTNLVDGIKALLAQSSKNIRNAYVIPDLSKERKDFEDKINKILDFKIPFDKFEGRVDSAMQKSIQSIEKKIMQKVNAVGNKIDTKKLQQRMQSLVNPNQYRIDNQPLYKSIETVLNPNSYKLDTSSIQNMLNTATDPKNYNFDSSKMQNMLNSVADPKNYNFDRSKIQSMLDFATDPKSYNFDKTGLQKSIDYILNPNTYGLNQIKSQFQDIINQNNPQKYRANFAQINKQLNNGFIQVFSDFNKNTNQFGQKILQYNQILNNFNPQQLGSLLSIINMVGQQLRKLGISIQNGKSDSISSQLKSISSQNQQIIKQFKQKNLVPANSVVKQTQNIKSLLNVIKNISSIIIDTYNSQANFMSDFIYDMVKKQVITNKKAIDGVTQQIKTRYDRKIQNYLEMLVDDNKGQKTIKDVKAIIQSNKINKQPIFQWWDSTNKVIKLN